MGNAASSGRFPHMAEKGVHATKFPLKFQKTGSARWMGPLRASVKFNGPPMTATRILGPCRDAKGACHVSWYRFGRKLERLGVGGRRSA